MATNSISGTPGQVQPISLSSYSGGVLGARGRANPVPERERDVPDRVAEPQEGLPFNLDDAVPIDPVEDSPPGAIPAGPRVPVQLIHAGVRQHQSDTEVRLMHGPARPQFTEHRVRIINEPGVGQVNGHSRGPSSRTSQITYVVHVGKCVHARCPSP